MCYNYYPSASSGELGKKCAYYLYPVVEEFYSNSKPRYSDNFPDYLKRDYWYEDRSCLTFLTKAHQKCFGWNLYSYSDSNQDIRNCLIIFEQLLMQASHYKLPLPRESQQCLDYFGEVWGECFGHPRVMAKVREQCVNYFTTVEEGQYYLSSPLVPCFNNYPLSWPEISKECVNKMKAIQYGDSDFLQRCYERLEAMTNSCDYLWERSTEHEVCFSFKYCTFLGTRTKIYWY